MQTTKLNNSKCCSTTSMEFIFFSKIERKLFEIFVKLETFIPSRYAVILRGPCANDIRVCAIIFKESI